jgi:O-antigen/teichoic acid export membrane protein
MFQTKLGSSADAGRWVLASQGGSHLLRLLTSIALTRLLAPEAFGLIAIAMTFVTAIQMISDLGLRQIVITSQHSASSLFLDTVWSLQIIRGLVIFLIALCGAIGLYLGATVFWSSGTGVYSDPALPLVLAMIGISAVILGFESTGISMAVRNTNLKRLVAVDLLTHVISASMTLLMAYFYRSVWSLVIGNLVGATSRALLSRKVFSDHRNSFRLDKRYVKEILGFAKWIFASSGMGFLVNHADKIAFSLVMSAANFGTVAISISLLAVLLETLNRLVENVVFPKLSQAVQSDIPGQVAKTFFKFRFWLEAVIFFSIAFIWVSSDSIVDFLFDSRYQQAAEYLRILCLTQLWLVASCCSSLGLALGNTKLLATVTLVRLVLVVALPFVGYRYFGEVGVAWALVAAQIPAILIAILWARQLLGETEFNFSALLAWLFLPLGALTGYLVSSVLGTLLTLIRTQS